VVRVFHNDDGAFPLDLQKSKFPAASTGAGMGYLWPGRSSCLATSSRYGHGRVGGRHLRCDGQGMMIIWLSLPPSASCSSKKPPHPGAGTQPRAAFRKLDATTTNLVGYAKFR